MLFDADGGDEGQYALDADDRDENNAPTLDIASSLSSTLFIRPFRTFFSASHFTLSFSGALSDLDDFSDAISARFSPDWSSSNDSLDLPTSFHGLPPHLLSRSLFCFWRHLRFRPSGSLVPVNSTMFRYCSVGEEKVHPTQA